MNDEALPERQSSRVRVEQIRYDFEGVTMVGTLCVDDATTGRRPTVLVCHEGPGLSDHVRNRAHRLAARGYCAFALDYIGGGAVLPLEEVGARLGPLLTDAALTRRFGRAGLDVLLDRPEADEGRLAAIGFCFGGWMSLELARGGAPLQAVVGVHPGLYPSMHPEDNANITGSVLMCLGSDDPFVAVEARLAFEAEMRDGGVADWTVELYGGVGHSFTSPDIDGVPLPGFAYDDKADQRSWASTLRLLGETIGA